MTLFAVATNIKPKPDKSNIIVFQSENHHFIDNISVVEGHEAPGKWFVHHTRERYADASRKASIREVPGMIESDLVQTYSRDLVVVATTGDSVASSYVFDNEEVAITFAKDVLIPSIVKEFSS